MKLSLIFLISLVCGKKFKHAGCANKKGTYVINFLVHLNAPSKLMLEQYEEDKQKKRLDGMGAKHFFNRIFDSINADIQKYDIQVLGDYRYLSFEELDVPVGGDICSRPSVVLELMASMLQTVREPTFPGTGNRIVIFDCGFNLLMFPQGLVVPADACGHYIVAMYNPLPLFEAELKNYILQALANISFGSISPNSKMFATAACEYSKRCTAQNDFIGRFFQDVKSLRHTLYFPGNNKLFLSGNHLTGNVTIDRDLAKDDKTLGSK
jgi:hypothetical protein